MKLRVTRRRVFDRVDYRETVCVWVPSRARCMRSTEAVAAGGRGLGAKGPPPAQLHIRRMTFFFKLNRNHVLKNIFIPKMHN